MSDVITPMSPFEGLLSPGVHDAEGAGGIAIEERRGVAQLQLIVRKGEASQVARSFSTFLGRKSSLAPTEGAEQDGLLICATGPSEYWVFAEGRSPADALKELGDIVGNSVSLFDQSEARCVIRLTGSRVTDVLAKGAPLDLQSDALPAVGAFHSAIDHIPALVARRIEPERYDISIPRSYAGPFVTWLREAALEYGYTITKPKS